MVAVRDSPPSRWGAGRAGRLQAARSGKRELVYSRLKKPAAVGRCVRTVSGQQEAARGGVAQRARGCAMSSEQ